MAETGIYVFFTGEDQRFGEQTVELHRAGFDDGVVLADDSYQRTDAFRLWKGAGINGVIMSFRPLSPGVFSGLGIYRRLSAPIFTDRENRIAHITLAGVPWLHEYAPVRDDGDRLTLLSPRQRMILTCLVQGFTRRQIAEHLALSLHTVNEYVKGVFDQFGVHSQPALIARFRTGDGGDR